MKLHGTARTAVALALVLATSLALLVYERNASANTISLVVILMKVRARDSGAPVRNLVNRDFEVLDNGKRAELRYFHEVSSSDIHPNPLSFWFVAGCGTPYADSKSVLVLKRAEFVRHVLERLEPQDSAGVAHWCEETGAAQVDLDTTLDRQSVLRAIDASPQENSGGGQGGHGYAVLLKLLQGINRALPDVDFRPQPILLFLDSERISSTRERAEQFAREVLSHSSIVVCAPEEESRSTRRLSGNSESLLAYLTKETGGQLFSAERYDGRTGVDAVIAAFHGGYQLAFAQGAPDGAWHKVEIKLAKGAIPNGMPVILSYRSGYLSVTAGLRYVVSEYKSPPEQTAPLLQSRAGADEKAFSLSAQGAMYEEDSRLAQFKLKVDHASVSWADQAEGRQHSALAVETSFLSSDGQTVERKLASYEITRGKINAWSLPEPVEILTYSEVPRNTSRIRLVIRDESSGRVGVREVSMQEVLATPKLPHVIY